MMKMKELKTDVLIIGAGLSGCRAAIESRKEEAEVILLNQETFGYSGSSFNPKFLTWGRGVAVSLKDCGPNDTPQSLYEDAIEAGKGLADPSLLRILVDETPSLIREIEKQGVRLTYKSHNIKSKAQDYPDFGKNVRGVGIYNPENFRKRISKWVKSTGAKIIENTMCLKLLGDSSNCQGAVAVNKNGTILIIKAGATILATGGFNNLYRYSFSSPSQAGVGHGLALEIGAELVNIEFHQCLLGITAPFISPFPEIYLKLLPKITNNLGEEFIENYLPNGISTEDVLQERSKQGPFHIGDISKYFDVSLIEEIRADRGTKSGGVFADFRGLSDIDLNPSFFPYWKNWVRRNKLGIFSFLMELSIFSQACNGGIKINSKGETKVSGLFACGEVIGGPHGANRIGGTQIAAGLVFGRRAGQNAAKKALETNTKPLNKAQINEAVGKYIRSIERKEGITPKRLKYKLQNTMWHYNMINKNEEGLINNLKIISELKDSIKEQSIEEPERLFTALSLPYSLIIAEVITKVALLRKESRGPHYRSDFPVQNDDEYKHRYLCGLKDGKLFIRTDKV